MNWRFVTWPCTCGIFGGFWGLTGMFIAMGVGFVAYLMVWADDNGHLASSDQEYAESDLFGEDYERRQREEDWLESSRQHEEYQQHLDDAAWQSQQEQWDRDSDDRW